MPRTQVVERTIYKFSELSDSAKQHAISEYSGDMGDWWDSVYEDAINIATLMGITTHKDRIYFSGFSSQGDGASFRGSYAPVAGSVDVVKAHAPGDTELHAIAQALHDLQAGCYFELHASITTSERYNHSGAMDVEAELHGPSEARLTLDPVSVEDAYGEAGAVPNSTVLHTLPNELVKELTTLLRDFADWIYKQLEKEYEYQTSEEVVAEMSEANGWEYDEQGNLI